MKTQYFRFFLLLLFFRSSLVFSQLTVTQGAGLGMTPLQLVQTMLVGQGVTISNVTFNGSSSLITSNQIGSFQCVGGAYTQLGLSGGIIISSGTAVGAIGPNNTGGFTGNIPPGVGDPDLNITVLNPVPFFCDNQIIDVRDNQSYSTVSLGTQCWMAANLNFGTQILSTSMQRDNCIVEKYCLNDNNANCLSSGGLYQWDEMMQFEPVESSQGLCPPAWHVPSEAEWNILFSRYISNGFAGSPLKYTGYSGFNALLSGIRFDDSNWNFDAFATFIWSSTTQGPYKAWAHSMNSFNPSVSYHPSNRSNAFYIRCIKN